MQFGEDELVSFNKQQNKNIIDELNTHRIRRASNKAQKHSYVRFQHKNTGRVVLANHSLIVGANASSMLSSSLPFNASLANVAKKALIWYNRSLFKVILPLLMLDNRPMFTIHLYSLSEVWVKKVKRSVRVCVCERLCVGPKWGRPKLSETVSP